MLDDVAISHAQRNGFAYIRTGNGSTPTLADTIGSVSILNSTFSDNATLIGGSARGDILLFGYNQDLTISNVDIGSPGAFAQKAIQMRGIQHAGNVVNTGPYDQAGDVAINNLTITGTYVQDVIAFYRIAGFDSFTGSNNSVNVNAPWAVINMDEVGSSVDLSSFFSSTSNLAVPSWIATLQELAGADTFIGTSGADQLVGRDGADVLHGGAGNDTITGGNGNDTIQYTVGDGVDTIDGGANTDTLAVSGTVGSDTIDVVVNGSGVITSIEGMSPTNVENYTVNGLGNNAAGDTLDYSGTANAVAVNLGTSSATGFTSVTGIENVTGGSAGDTLAGDSNANVLTGGGGNDTLTGAGGDDTLVGGSGIDTAVYSASLNASAVTEAGSNFVVTTGGAEGTDTLSGIEQISDGAGHHFLLVGHGGYATIQAAVDAATAGDTILIAAGHYREQVTISGKDITLQGAGVGQTIIESPNSAALVESYHESNSGLPYRYSVVTVKDNSDVTITGVTVDGRDQGGIVSRSRRLQLRRRLRDQLRRRHRRHRGHQCARVERRRNLRQPAQPRGHRHRLRRGGHLPCRD